jgi:putative peptidoglycan lipid II flippase
MSISFSKQSIGQASILIAVFTVISQALGLIRESLIANFLGTSAEYDIILVALAIPSMIGTILMTALPSAGIPTLQNGGSPIACASNILRSSFFRINLIIGFILMAVVMVSLPYLGRLLGTGLEKESVGLVLKYGYLFCLLIPIRTLEAAFQSFMHVRFHFIFPAISTIAFNIVIIGLLAGLFPSLGSPIYVIAVIAGTFMEMALIGVPAFLMYRKSDSRSVTTQFSTPEYVRLLGMIALVEAIGLLVDPFDRYIAGIYLSPGYVSANYYANLVGQLPIRIVVVSLSVAIFPSLSEMAAAKDIKGLSSLYHRAIAICLMLIIPIAVYSFFFRNEIISFLFERGRFNERSRELTSGVFFYYTIAMIFSAIYFVQSRVLFSLRVWGNLLWARIIGLAVKIIFGILLIKEHWALAIGGGSMVMSALSAVIIEYNLYKNLNIRHNPTSMRLILKALLGSIIISPIIIIIGFGLRNIVGLHSIILLATAGVFMIMSFLIVDYILGITGVDVKKWLMGRSR